MLYLVPLDGGFGAKFGVLIFMTHSKAGLRRLRPALRLDIKTGVLSSYKISKKTVACFQNTTHGDFLDVLPDPSEKGS